MEENYQDFNKVKNNKDNKRFYLIGIIVIFILISILFFLIFLLQKRTQIIGRAYTPSVGKVELANSYLFASPLKAKAGGREKIRVTVFILDSQGKGVLGKEVVFGSDLLQVQAVQSITDDLGRAIFDVSSLKKGLFLVEASVDGKTIPQKLSLSFE